MLLVRKKQTAELISVVEAMWSRRSHERYVQAQLENLIYGFASLSAVCRMSSSCYYKTARNLAVVAVERLSIADTL